MWLVVDILFWRKPVDPIKVFFCLFFPNHFYKLYITEPKSCSWGGQPRNAWSTMLVQQGKGWLPKAGMHEPLLANVWGSSNWNSRWEFVFLLLGFFFFYLWSLPHIFLFCFILFLIGEGWTLTLIQSIKTAALLFWVIFWPSRWVIMV